MAHIDELRLMTKVARLYYERGLRQSQIANQLALSQTTISRLLKRAEQEQIVRIRISVPPGAYPDLEDALQTSYQLKDVIVVDCADDESDLLRQLGAAAAHYVETTIRQGDTIGISSRSISLLAMLDAMHPLAHLSKANVVQILGSIGEPTDEAHAAHLTRRLAELMHGNAIFLPAPGVVGSADARRILMEDQYVRDVSKLFDHLDLALVGIGATEPHKLLASQGNFFTQEELDTLKSNGAVGNICLRFYNINGEPVITPIDNRIVGVEYKHLQQATRTVGIVGGQNKFAAILGAIKGGWINVLITDRFTAERLRQV